MGGEKSFSGHVPEGDDPGPTIAAALHFAEEFALHAHLGAAPSARLLVAVEELVSNALRHGGGVTVEMILRDSLSGTHIELADDGVEFDPSRPRAFHGPDRESGGGVGLELVRTWAGVLEYTRRDGRNRLVVVLPPKPEGGSPSSGA